MPKLAWVVLPLALYGGGLAIALLRRRPPTRHALNVQLSVLLTVYLLATAGLGIFWVANQQLPVFDWHYLFGYGTLALVGLHLWFNLPVVWRALRRPQGPRPGAAGRRTDAVAAGPSSIAASTRRWPAALLVLAALGGGYLLGTARTTSPAAPSSPVADAVAPVLRFHAQSSLSRGGVFASAPGIDWGDAPPPFKHYQDKPQVAIGRAAVATAGLSSALRSVAPRSLDLRADALGELLHLAAGITGRRGGQVLRAAPSSGGLFPSELYVLARRVQGLAPGMYHYDAERRSLASLGKLPADDAGMADADVVLTSVFHRSGHKYKERAWRYAAADAGHLLENLRVASRAAGVQAVLLPRFDEGRLAGMLGIDGVREAVLAVMTLDGRAGTDPAGGQSPVPASERAEAQVFVPLDAGARSAAAGMGATGDIQQATSLALAVPAGSRPARVVTLPAAQAALRPVDRVIGERRSKRRFTADAVPPAALSSLLADLDQRPQLSGAVRIDLVVNRVQGLAPGVYRYLGGHELALRRQGEFAAAAQSAALAQQVIGDAAVVLVLSADRAAALAEGARGYRHAFLEAGMVGQRWLLGATARGLGACPVGAFYDDEAAALAGLDPAREWVLHLAALGVAQE